MPLSFKELSKQTLCNNEPFLMYLKYCDSFSRFVHHSYGQDFLADKLRQIDA